MSGGLILLTLALTSVGLVISFRYIAKWHAVKSRQPLDMADLHAASPVSTRFDTFRDVFEIIGKAYGIDPRLIRSEDEISRYIRADSWRLDYGTEIINEWLVANGVTDEISDSIRVMDLISLIDKRRGGSG